MSHDALELVRLRNNFYRDNYRKVMSALLVSVLIIFMLAGTVIFLATRSRPMPEYFATTNGGRLIPMVPLSQPLLNKQDVFRWATQAAMGVYSYDFSNYKQQLQRAQKYFTLDGWKSLVKQMSSNNNLKAVIKKQLIVNAVPAGAPILLNQGLMDGRYAWKLRLPLLVTYQSGSGKSFQEALMVTMVLERVSTLDNAQGIGVTQFIAQQN